MISFYPAYANYRYVVVDDEICIVEPSTYEIVDVIPASIVDDRVPDTPSAPVFQLSSSQQRCVVDTLPRDRARAGLEFSLDLNSQVPVSVELLPLPQDVVQCAAALDGYRYVIVDNQVVIVEPADRRIVLALRM